MRCDFARLFLPRALEYFEAVTSELQKIYRAHGHIGASFFPLWRLDREWRGDLDRVRSLRGGTADELDSRRTGDGGTSDEEPKMNPLRWTREHRIAFFVATVFGACMGFIVGLRRVDPSLVQNFYWLRLAMWIISGAVLGAIGAIIRQTLRRP